MTTSGRCVFNTALGHCGLAWSALGVLGVQLPEGSADATGTRLAERFPELDESRVAVSVRPARDGIVALLAGRDIDLSSIALDLRAVTPFRQRVYSAARTIPRGITATYGELAAALGQPGSARAVGQALGANPFPVIVPCHRILAAGGKSGGFTAAGGVSTKMRMLAIEGAGEPLSAALAPVVDKSGFSFDLTLAVDHLRRADRKLARLIDKVGPCTMRVRPTGSTFAALAEAIVYQQLNGRAAATIFERVRALFPRARGTLQARHVLAADESALRGAGLSQAKMLALKDLAGRTVAGEIPTLAALAELDDEAVIACLVPVRGIGRWTVEMLLMGRLGRPDVLPVDDYGVRQGFAVTYGRAEQPSRDELRQHGERWRPYRSIASWYMWRAVELARS